MDEQEAFDQVYQSLASIIKREKESAEAYRKQILEQDPLDVSDDFVRGNMKLEDELQLKKTLQKLDMTVCFVSLLNEVAYSDTAAYEHVDARRQAEHRVYQRKVAGV